MYFFELGDLPNILFFIEPDKDQCKRYTAAPTVPQSKSEYKKNSLRFLRMYLYASNAR